MAIKFTIQRQDRTFNAQADGGASFFVGLQTRYFDKSAQQWFEGLYNVPNKKLPPLRYQPEDIRDSEGFWADLIWPTAQCEGGNYLTLNTYDRARFTWGFGQFAAHVPDGDFVRFFREVISKPAAQSYFPGLFLHQGRIAMEVNGIPRLLETAETTGPLLDYLNPSTAAVEDPEVIAAARLIHWTTNDADMRRLQARHMAETFKRLMREADKRLDLDGRGADICCVICDIRHQGRARYTSMQAALASANPLASLLKLGEISYPDRIKTLKKALQTKSELFGKQVWSRTSGRFVAI